MKSHNCETCAFRAVYRRKPRSLLGRIWKWHIGWCPGWKKYMAALPSEDRKAVQDELDGTLQP